MMYILSCVVHKFFLMAGRIVHQHFHFALFRPDDHTLAAHAAHHIERIHWAATQRQFQDVLLNALFQCFFQFVGNFEKPVGRTQPTDTLVGAFVIVVLHPEGGALHRLLEAVELSPLEELAQDRFPETLDLAQGHGMVRTRADVLDAVLFHLPFETRLAPPVRVLPAVVGEHLLGHAILGNTAPVGLQHVGRRLAAVQPQAGDIPTVIVHEADQVGVATRQPEGHDVALPQLVGTGALEEPGFGRVLHRLALGFVHQPLLGQGSMNRRGTGSHQEESFEDIGDPARAVFRVIRFDSDHPLADFRRRVGFTDTVRLSRQPFDALLAIQADPALDGGAADAELLGKQYRAVAFFQKQPYDL
jgi:hypothetical protein